METKKVDVYFVYKYFLHIFVPNLKIRIMKNNQKTYWVVPGIEVQDESPESKASRLFERVFRKTRFTREDLSSKARYREYVETRQIMMYILHKKYGIPLMTVGRMFNRNHATVLHAYRTIEGYMEYDAVIREKVNELI